MASGSRLALYAAIAGNLGIALTKLVAGLATGSSAMLAEAIHSAVDTGDGLLMLFGMRLARRPPDPEHPFGHGQELYFWTFVVAVLIFAVGGGMSMYEGLGHLATGEATKDVGWNYLVLAVAAGFELASWSFAVRGFRRVRRGRGVWRAIRETKDPTVVAVLLEDTAALVGLAVAAAGIAIGHATGSPIPEAGASILIGLLLAGVAWILAREARGLLTGEAASRETVDGIQRAIERDPAVRSACRPLTMHLGPEELLVNVRIDFRPDLEADELRRAIARLEQAIRARHPEASRIYLEAGPLAGEPAG